MLRTTLWGAHFLNISISTSKNPPNVKCSEPWFAFSLADVLCATTACNAIVHGSAPTALATVLFRPPGPHIIGEARWIVNFLDFSSPAFSLFWFFSSLRYSSLLLSDSSGLCFSCVHMAGSLTSKLVSVTWTEFLRFLTKHVLRGWVLSGMWFTWPPRWRWFDFWIPKNLSLFMSLVTRDACGLSGWFFLDLTGSTYTYSSACDWRSAVPTMLYICIHIFIYTYIY